MAGGKMFLARRSKTKKTVKKNARAIAKLISSIETKENYTFRSLASALVGDSFFGLNGMMTGVVGQGDRIGSEVVSKFINVKLHGELENDISVNTGKLRVMLLVNHLNNSDAAKPPIAEILRQVATNEQKYISQYNNDFVGKGKKYTILRDRRIFFHVQNGPSSFEINWRIPIRYKIRYNDVDAGDSGDIINHDILLYVNSPNALVKYSYSSTYGFTDP